MRHFLIATEKPTLRTKPIGAEAIEARKGQTIYPAPFDAVVAGRTRKKLGDVFGLTNFGINLTRLEPGSASALFHYHTIQDEFIYVLEGRPTVIFGDEEHELSPGECMGFKAGTGIAHQLVNRSNADVVYLEIGDRLPGDDGDYPNDDLRFRFGPDGEIILAHKDGTPY